MLLFKQLTPRSASVASRDGASGISSRGLQPMAAVAGIPAGLPAPAGGRPQRLVAIQLLLGAAKRLLQRFGGALEDLAGVVVADGGDRLVQRQPDALRDPLLPLRAGV